ncbi:MAG: DUF3109 family protein [Bacteroidia bacterium]
MLIVGNALISEDIFEKNFICHLEKCKGACCVSGDRGAPLDEEEIEILKNNLESIKPLMDGDGLDLLDETGFYETDPADGELVTTCRQNGACVFVVYENGITQCAIEKAYKAGKTDFKKPMSCHLYPIRAAEYGDYTVLNYNQWDICNPACSLGEEQNLPLHKFLKEPLIRKMGAQWYEELEEVSKNWKGKDGF